MLTRTLLVLLLILLPHTLWATASESDGGAAQTTKVQVTSTSDIQTTAFSACWWSYRIGAGESSNPRIVSKADDGNGGFNIYEATGPTRELFDAVNSIAFGEWQITAPADNTWYGRCWSFDGSSTANDPSVFDHTGSSVSVTENIAPAATYVAGTNPLVLFNNGAQTATWNGRIANFALYNRTITANEAKAILTCSPKAVPNGLVLFWPMGVFGGRNYTSTASLTGTETAVTISATGPPVRCPQGGFISDP